MKSIFSTAAQRIIISLVAIFLLFSLHGNVSHAAYILQPAGTALDKSNLSPERILFMCSVGTAPANWCQETEQKKAVRTATTTSTEKDEVRTDKLKIKELEDQIIQIKRQILILQIQQLLQQLKK